MGTDTQLNYLQGQGERCYLNQGKRSDREICVGTIQNMVLSEDGKCFNLALDQSMKYHTFIYACISSSVILGTLLGTLEVQLLQGVHE